MVCCCSPPRLSLTFQALTRVLRLLSPRSGAVAFVTQGYRTGLVLESGGALVVGQQQRRTGCGPDSRTSLLLSGVTRGTPSPSSNIHTLTPYMLVPAQGGCSWAGQVVPGKGFVGNVQNLRVWEYVLTPPEVGHGMVWPFERSHVRRGPATPCSLFRPLLLLWLTHCSSPCGYS